MYLLVPLIIFALSSLGILIIISRKIFYLKKLDPEILENGTINSGSVGKGFWSDFYPEVYEFFSKIDLAPYKNSYFSWSEKLLRRLRVMSLKIDSFTHSLITKVRISAIAHKQQMLEQASVVESDAEKIKGEPVVILSKEERARQREQELILEISQNPKSANLYDELGRVYLRLNNFQDAVESFRMALRLEPENEDFKTKLEKAEKKVAK